MIFVSVGLIGILLIAVPALSAVIHFPNGEPFSELYVLGPERTLANYPSTVVSGQNYTVYVGVGNHMSSSIYYTIYVKFRNQTEFLPNATTGVPSPLQPLYEYRFFVESGQTWESPLVFSISQASLSGNQSMIQRLTINNVTFNVNKTATIDTNSSLSCYQLFIELWIYNPLSNSIQFNNRFVAMPFNLTVTT